jgi:hypothetical protein
MKSQFINGRVFGIAMKIDDGVKRLRFWKRVEILWDGEDGCLKERRCEGHEPD